MLIGKRNTTRFIDLLHPVSAQEVLDAHATAVPWPRVGSVKPLGPAMRHAGCELLRGAGRLGLGRGNWACEVLLQDSAGFSLEAIFGNYFAEDHRHKRNGTWFWQTFPIIVQVVLPLFFFARCSLCRKNGDVDTPLLHFAYAHHQKLLVQLEM